MATPKKVIEEKRLKQLIPGRLKLAESMCNHWFATVDPDVIRDDIVKADFWAHLSERLRQHDMISIVPDTGEWRAEVTVLQSGRNWAKVKILEWYELGEGGTPVVSHDYDIAWRGPHRLWSVVRKSDSEIIKEGIPSRDDANSWLADFEK